MIIDRHAHLLRTDLGNVATHLPQISEFPLSHPKVEPEKILRPGLAGDARERVLRRNIHEFLKLNDLRKRPDR